MSARSVGSGYVSQRSLGSFLSIGTYKSLTSTARLLRIGKLLFTTVSPRADSPLQARRFEVMWKTRNVTSVMIEGMRQADAKRS